MIVPTKYLTESETILGIGSIILSKLQKESSLSELWENIKWNSYVGTYERFILGLDLLFFLGIIDIRNNRIVRDIL
jgi:hypothetical protein